LVNLFDIDINNTITLIKKFFSDQSDEVINKNIEAVKIGYDTSKNILGPVKDSINIRKSDKVKNEILMNGTDSIGLGAIAGGCNFIASYPMSPSTGTLIFLANHAKEFEIIVEQAEDEISAINMGLGAWYAGARAMVTTSGGGFDLMVEALSLAGCIESPMVIHLAQRPGPATGLPTRTEQGDLDIALYSGHGEFPRIIFAPRGIEDGFYLTQKAFNITDKYHVPVIILTDQYFLDSYYNISEIDISNIRIERYIIKTAKNYKRYRITESGISPRGIPGYGEGYVKVDSDEHNEYGNITEDFIMRENMVNKRLRKMEQIKKEINPPIFIGRENYKHIVVGWGSTYNVIKEALEILGRDDIAFLHFNHIYPFSDGTRDLLIKADKKVIIENNATSQFGKLVKIFTGVDFNEKILKYNGLPFMLEEVVDSLDKIF
jgi:2-oxoglutarate ferredoxin oxidoreductase subunit alpha